MQILQLTLKNTKALAICVVTNPVSNVQVAPVPAAPDKTMARVGMNNQLCRHVSGFHEQMISNDHHVRKGRGNKTFSQFRWSRFAQSSSAKQRRAGATRRTKALPMHPVGRPCRVEANLFDAQHLVLVIDDKLWTISWIDLNRVVSRSFELLICPWDVLILTSPAISAAGKLFHATHVNLDLQHAANAGVWSDGFGFGGLR